MKTSPILSKYTEDEILTRDINTFPIEERNSIINKRQRLKNPQRKKESSTYWQKENKEYYNDYYEKNKVRINLLRKINTKKATLTKIIEKFNIEKKLTPRKIEIAKDILDYFKENQIEYKIANTAPFLTRYMF
jgi:hypothetical protein